MNLHEIQNQMTTLGAQINAAAAALAQRAGDPNVSVADLQNEQTALNALQDRMNVLRNTYDTMSGEQTARLQPAVREEKTMNRSEIRSSNEYARAFAYAMRHGLNRRNGAGNENVKILFDALSEGGGNPAGTDGGFLVPVDFDNQIHEVVRQLNPLADYVNVENVTSATGWRVVDTAPAAAMPAVNELGTIASSSSDSGYEQPAFVKVPYTLVKYGLRIPVSNELLADETAGLMNYLAGWFGKKLVLTQNSLILAAMKTLTASALVSGTETAEAGIKAVLNKALDPAISNSAIIITNQTGFDALDQLVDGDGRGLLQPDPTNATLLRIFGRPVVRVSDAQLPNTSSKPEFFIGDGKAFCTLFQHDGFEVSSTDVGGNAWATDSTEVRGIARMCVSKMDAAAMVRRQLTLS